MKPYIPTDYNDWDYERKRKYANYRPVAAKGKFLQQHGAREMARRKAQIAKGQLKAENGLVV